MNLDTAIENGVLILKPDGRIDGSNAFEFQSSIDEAVGEDDIAVILDLSDLTYISSAGLRVILLLAKKMRSQNSQLLLCSIANTVKDVFEISGFGRIIPTYDSRADAIGAVSR